MSEAKVPSQDEQAPAAKPKSLVFYVLLALCLVLPVFGKGGLMAAIVLGGALLGVPLFALIGIVTVAGFFLYKDYTDIARYSPMVERMRGLIDQKTLIAIPLFIMSGAVMSRGQISVRLIDFARSCVGWIPGGLGISAVFACVFFAAISGSSPATVIAIGAMMGPALVKSGYGDRFSHGLLSSAGSLGILIPPSIPMIIYPIVYQGAVIETELLFASGFGPGLVMAALLMGYCVVYGIGRPDIPRDPFELKQVGRSFVRGFWALMFPVLILGGIYGGIYTTVEAAGFSVVYAVLVEVYIHRAMTLEDIPETFKETGIFLGSLLVIMVAALALDELLHELEIPEKLAHWIESQELEGWQFLLILNGLLLLVGMAMDILSAMFIFVPLLAPVAVAMGVDPLHFGIIFIVNLEIGYLTPPVGLNLFVASTLFERPLGHIIRSVLPFIGLMVIGLGVITYWPGLSVGLGHWVMGREQVEIPAGGPGGGALQPLDDGALDGDDGDGDVQTLEQMMNELEGGGDDEGGVQTLEEMMNELEEGEGSEDEGGVQTLEEMMREAEEEGSGEGAEAAPAEEPDRVLSLEEMMEQAGVD